MTFSIINTISQVFLHSQKYSASGGNGTQITVYWSSTVKERPEYGSPRCLCSIEITDNFKPESIRTKNSSLDNELKIKLNNKWENHQGSSCGIVKISTKVLIKIKSYGK